jgi:signal transduction histidine kinase
VPPGASRRRATDESDPRGVFLLLLDPHSGRLGYGGGLDVDVDVPNGFDIDLQDAELAVLALRCGRATAGRDVMAQPGMPLAGATTEVCFPVSFGLNWHGVLYADRSALGGRREEHAGRREARAELAQEIHAGPVQRISAVSTAIGSRQLSDDDLARCGVELRGALTEIRHLLLPERVDPVGDASSLRSDLRAVADDPSSARDLSLAWPDDLNLSQAQEERMRAFVIDALGNVERHAPASEVRIAVGRSADTVFATVENDGYTPRDASSEPGIGLRLTQLEVAAHGGRFEYGPVAGGRWRVTLELPA